MPGLYETLITAPQTAQQTYANNQQYAANPGQTNYNTALPQMDEFSFRQWAQDNKVPFNADSAAPQDYDMRGYWQGLMQQNPKATSGMNANDGQLHFSDYWKTPSHQSFSNESKYAAPNAPQWVNDSQLAAPNGRVVYDEKNR